MAVKLPDEPRTSCIAKSVRMDSKNDGDRLRGCRSQFEGAPMDQVWDNVSVKIKNDSNE